MNDAFFRDNGHTQMIFNNTPAKLSAVKGGERRCFGCMRVYSIELNACPYCGFPARSKTDTTTIAKPGTSVNSRFLIGKCINYSGFEATYLARDALYGKSVFLREYLPEGLCGREKGKSELTVFPGEKSELFDFGAGRFIEETQKYAAVKAQGAARCYDIAEANNTVYAVYDYEEGQLLRDILKEVGAVDEETSSAVILSLAETLADYHAAGLPLLNVNTQNIWITSDGKVMLLYPGEAKCILDSFYRNLSRFDGYSLAAYEQCCSFNYCDESTDIYGLGALYYKMVSGENPPSSIDRFSEIKSKGKDPLVKNKKWLYNTFGSRTGFVINTMQILPQDRPQDVVAAAGEMLEGKKTSVRKTSLKREDNPKLRHWLVGVLSAACIVIVAGAVLSLLGFFGPGKLLNSKYSVEFGNVSIPDMIADGYSDWSGQASLKGVRISISYVAETPGVEKNIIISQEPAAFEVVPYGSTVHVVISSGYGSNTVKNVVGFTLENAQAILESSGFTVQVKEEYRSNYAKDVVFDQNVEPGTVLEKGNEITLFVSKGSDNINSSSESTVPNLLNATYENALKMLKDTQIFIAIEEYDYNPNIKDGIILSQKPDPYESIRAGDIVYVTVNQSEGDFYMPDLKRIPLDKAQSELDRLGIKYKVSYTENDMIDEGTVINQTVESGTKLSPGDEVELTVAKIPTVKVPDVVGMTYGEAKKELLHAGLASTVQGHSHGMSDNTEIKSMSYRAGATVKSGTEIILFT